MGESVVERPPFENKMGESVPSAASLQVSVSFGRFESDSLSWEKWSSFSPNKYLEEVEKCSTPGSVAQKKAYFEAHYKKIAARKTAQLEQEKLMDSVPPPSSDEPDSRDPVNPTAIADGESGLSGSGRSAENVEPDVSGRDISAKCATIDEEKDDAIALDCQRSVVEEDKEELNGTSANSVSNDAKICEEELISNLAEPELSGGAEAVLVQEDNSEKTPLKVVEQTLKMNHKAKQTPLDKSKSLRLSSRNVTQKITPSRKEQTMAGAKKKVVSPAARSSPVTKLSQLSTPRLSKSTVVPASVSTIKKGNGSSLPRAKNTPGERRRSMPTSLHMSLSLDPASSGPCLTTTRKSLIMERMGDKDIVRRAFKTFQNSILKSSNDELSSRSPQVSYKGPEKNVSTMTTRKENEGLRKSAENTIQKERTGNTSNLAASRSTKSSGVDKRVATVVSSSTGLKNDARAEKWKEKPGEKSFVKEAERPHFSSKTKEAARVRNTGQGLKSKASLVPSFNGGQGSTKTLSEKEKSKDSSSTYVKKVKKLSRNAVG